MIIDKNYELRRNVNRVIGENMDLYNMWAPVGAIMPIIADNIHRFCKYRGIPAMIFPPDFSILPMTSSIIPSQLK